MVDGLLQSVQALMGDPQGSGTQELLNALMKEEAERVEVPIEEDTRRFSLRARWVRGGVEVGWEGVGGAGTQGGDFVALYTQGQGEGDVLHGYVGFEYVDEEEGRSEGEVTVRGGEGEEAIVVKMVNRRGRDLSAQRLVLPRGSKEAMTSEKEEEEEEAVVSPCRGVVEGEKLEEKEGEAVEVEHVMVEAQLRIGCVHVMLWDTHSGLGDISHAKVVRGKEGKGWVVSYRREEARFQCGLAMPGAAADAQAMVRHPWNHFVQMMKAASLQFMGQTF